MTHGEMPLTGQSVACNLFICSDESNGVTFFSND